MVMGEIISLSNLKFRGIEDVISRMENYLHLFDSSPQYHHLRSFLKVYLLVTKTIQERCSSNQFNNPRKMESLDIYFANLYFKPLDLYLSGQKVPSPWKTYFEYVDKKADPFVLMLLGINAHINSDLLQSLIYQNYLEFEDYEKVNDVLLEVIPKIMTYLTIEEKDIWGLGGLVFARFAKFEFRNTIVRWRQETWKNFQLILNANSKNFDLKDIHQQTETLAKDIIFEFKSITKMHKIIENFQRLNRSRVSA